MSHAAYPPHLRLVGVDDDESRWRDQQKAKLDVIKENRIAAHAPGLDPGDPRWVLAMQTQARLQGTLLTPEHREHLIKTGARLGMRPFESNLVIAIVQDRARVGLKLDSVQPTLTLLGQSLQPSPSSTVWPRIVLALAAAAAVTALLLRWLSASLTG